MVVDGWDSKTEEWGADEISLMRRAARMRKWLKDRDEEEIVVVTHGGIKSSRKCTEEGFLLYLVQEVRGFENMELRTYTFSDCEEAILIPLEDK